MGPMAPGSMTPNEDMMRGFSRGRVINKNKEGRPVATTKKTGGKGGVKNQFGPSGGRIISK